MAETPSVGLQSEQLISGSKTKNESLYANGKRNNTTLDLDSTDYENRNTIPSQFSLNKVNPFEQTSHPADVHQEPDYANIPSQVRITILSL